MKKIFYLTALVFILGACSDNLTDLNVDKKNPPEVPAGTLIANSLVSMFDWMQSTNVNENNFRLWAQYWAQTTYPDESNYELVERRVHERTWNRFYATVIRDAREAKPFIEADQFLTQSEKNAQYAILDVIEIMSFAYLVDIFGDVPYTQAFSDDVTPAYDDDEAIYTDLIARLDGAIQNLNGSSGLGDYDLIYGGSTAAWKKCANSLKLRMAIRIADKDPNKAKAMAESAVSSGVFTSSADNFAIQYSSTPPNTNPLWEDLVQSGRSDFVAANTLVDVMNALNDPRRAHYFSGPMDANGNPIGGTYGASNNFNANSQAGEKQKDPTFPGTLMSYSEVRFLLADAAARGFNVGGTPAEHYNAGVTESILEWGGSESQASNYLAQPDVAYSTAQGDWKQKIATQKWIALYNNGFEGWTTYRLYDHPAMNIAEGAQTTPPLRFTYPTNEYSLNIPSVEAAAEAIGGDDLFSRVFWDVN